MTNIKEGTSMLTDNVSKLQLADGAFQISRPHFANKTLHHSRVGALTNTATAGGRSGNTTDDSDDGQAVSGRRGMQNTPSMPWSPTCGATEEVASLFDDFFVVVSKHQKRTLSVHMKAGGDVTNPSDIGVTDTTNLPKRRDKVFIGNAAVAPSTDIKAASDLTRKAVFCVSNLNNDVTCDKLNTFVTFLGVRVLSCFVEKMRYSNTKSFRVCINRENQNLFLNIEKWPKSVTLRNWSFSSKVGAETVVAQPSQTTNIRHIVST